ncbi:MAG: branched-chain amino acid ABC transporter permease [Deltaproteobacteria bacterium]|nr:branched-chain amino acid ABC transporter permease [Deltaproteobacteria bacterium]
MSRKAKRSLTTNTWFLFAVAFFAVFPIWAPVMWKHLATEIFIIALFAMSLNMVLGRGGLPSFGHACFYCVGGYTIALFMMKLHFPFAIAVIAAPVVAAIFAAIIGYFSVRLTGIHFAILTLGFSQLVWAIAHKWYGFTKGDDGITGIPVPAALRGITHYYYFVFVILITCLLLIRIVQNSPFGNTIVAIRENRERVTFSGLKVWHHLWLNFVIAGFFAGLAGSLLVLLNRAVFPDFGYWTKSAGVVLMCIFGGVGAFIGPIVGAAIITLLEHYISIYTFYWQLVLGCLIVILVIFLPGGICGFIENRLRGEKKITEEVPYASQSRGP